MKKLFISFRILFFFSIIFILSTSANKWNYKRRHGTATVTCENIQNALTTSGYPVSSGYTLGRVKHITFDSSSCQLVDLGTNLDLKNIASSLDTVETGTSSIQLAKNIEVSLQGGGGNKIQVEAAVKAKIQTSSRYTMYNTKVITIKNFTDLINQNTDLKAKITNQLNKGLPVFVISSITIGDSLSFSIDKDNRDSVSVNITVAHIKIDIINSCRSHLVISGQNGKPTILLYQIAYLALDNGNITTSITSPFDIGKCTRSNFVKVKLN